MGNLLQVLKNPVIFLLIEILRRRGGIVKPELNRRAGNLAEAFQIRNEVLGGIILVKHAVHPEGHRQTGQKTVVGFDDKFLHMPGNIDAGDLVLVFLRKREDVVLGLVFGDGKGGVDINLVSGRDFIQHPLQNYQVGKGLAASENEITIGSDGVHAPDAPADILRREAG